MTTHIHTKHMMFSDLILENKLIAQYSSHTIGDTLLNTQILDSWKTN
jgi:hypothetical protein